MQELRQTPPHAPDSLHQFLAGTLWSLGKLQFRAPQLLPLLAAQISQHLPDLDVWEVSNVITAFSRLQYMPESEQLLPALMQQALVRSRNDGSTDCSTSLQPVF